MIEKFGIQDYFNELDGTQKRHEQLNSNAAKRLWAITHHPESANGTHPSTPEELGVGFKGSNITKKQGGIMRDGLRGDDPVAVSKIVNFLRTVAEWPTVTGEISLPVGSKRPEERILKTAPSSPVTIYFFSGREHRLRRKELDLVRADLPEARNGLILSTPEELGIGGHDDMTSVDKRSLYQSIGGGSIRGSMTTFWNEIQNWPTEEKR